MLPHCPLPQQHQLHNITFTNSPTSTIHYHSKFQTTSSNTQSDHLPFTFHFIPDHPNYMSKLKLPMHIVKLCNDIQNKVELSIIKIQKYIYPNKKSKKKSKNRTSLTFKPRFQLIEHPPTSPTHTASKTDITTNTQ